MFRCCSLETSHPRLLPQSLKDCSINLCLLIEKDLNRCIAGSEENTFFLRVLLWLSYLKTKTHPPFLSPSAFDGIFGKKGGTLTGHYYAAVFLDKGRSWGSCLSWRSFKSKKLYQGVRKEFSLTLLRASGCIWKLKGQNQITGETYTHLFIISFMWFGSLREEMKTQRNRLTWVFDASSDEGWIVMEQYDRLRIMGKYSKLGTRTSPCHSDSSWHPLYSKVKMLLSSRYREDTSHMRDLWSVLGKRVGTKLEWSCFCCVLQLPELKIFSMSRYHILE